MIPVLNLLLCFLTAVIGNIAINIAHRLGAKIALLIATFWLSRIFAARAWIEITGSIFVLSTEPPFWIFLAATVFSMSIILIILSQISIGQSWETIGWKNNKLKSQLFILIPAILFLGFLTVISLLGNGDPGRLVAASIFSFLIASWQEETIFRGQLMSYLRHKEINILVVILSQAAVFSLVHIGFAPFDTLSYFLPSAFLLGFIFGIIRWKTDGQVGGFLLHGILNFMSIG